MKSHFRLLFFFLLFSSFFCIHLPVSGAKVVEPVKEFKKDLFSVISLPDPLEGYNRVVFEFNDFIMVWVFDPLMKGYSFILPKSGRKHIDMAIVNLEYFIHLFSCLLQGEFKGALVETERFFINITLGVVVR